MANDIIDVYWTPINVDTPLSILRYQDPVKAISTFPHKDSLIFKCPAFKDYYKNTFALKFPMDYTLDIGLQGQLSTPDYDAELINRMFAVRDALTKFYTMKIFHLMLSEESLPLQLSSAHTMDEDGFVNKTMLVPGAYDIGKWIRTIECAFFVKENSDRINIKEGNPYCFVKFNTEKTVRLNKFAMTGDMHLLLDEILAAKDISTKIGRPLVEFYKILSQSRYKKQFLKLVKENLL